MTNPIDVKAEEAKLSLVVIEVEEEVKRARALHGSMHSAHEGYAVLLEEIDELWAEIKQNPKKLSFDGQERLKRKIRTEAVQVAAMAVRFILDVCEKNDADP